MELRKGAGFPLHFVQRLLCPMDGAAVTVHSTQTGDAGSMLEGSLRCEKCGRTYPVSQGIVRLLSEEALDESARFEMQWRDSVGEEQQSWFESKLSSLLEIPQHIGALRLNPQSTLLELACGRGRFTVRFAQTCAFVLAVDFSLKSLEFLARRLPPESRVGLVQADITSLRLQPRTFNRAFSTSSLDSREQRLSMHRVVSEALSDDGIYVFSAEHNDWRNRLLGNPRHAYYPGSQISFYRMDRAEIVREAAPYFARLRVRPIQLFLPFLGSASHARLAQRSAMLARLAVRFSLFLERVPLVRNFANLLLLTATQPVRTPELNQRSRGSTWFRYIYKRANLPDTVP